MSQRLVSCEELYISVTFWWAWSLPGTWFWAFPEVEVVRRKSASGLVQLPYFVSGDFATENVSCAPLPYSEISWV